MPERVGVGRRLVCGYSPCLRRRWCEMADAWSLYIVFFVFLLAHFIQHLLNGFKHNILFDLMLLIDVAMLQVVC